LLVKPEGGFEITIYNVGEDAMVSSERWHTHYDDPQQAAFCLWWLLTPYYRIVHELKIAMFCLSSPTVSDLKSVPIRRETER